MPAQSHQSPRHSPRHSTPSSYRYPRLSPRNHNRNYTPATIRRSDLTLSSPILLEHPSWTEFEGDGLKAFIAHCEIKFKSTGTAFQEAYLKLRDHEIQPDIMRGKSVAWYEAKDIKSGTAERMVAVFNRWYAKMQQEA